MNYPNIITGKSGLFISAIALTFLTGCATPDNILQVNYLMPPRAINDSSAISPLNISADIKLTGNAIKQQDIKSVKNDIRGRLASRLNAEGFCKTVDILWGDSNGPAELQLLMQQKKFPHGYDLYSTPEIKSARLIIALNANIRKAKKQVKKSVELTYLPYSRNSGKVPSSTPNYKGVRIKKQQVKITVNTVDAAGTLQATLYDKTGKVVYQKTFNSLTYQGEYGDKKIAPTPVNSAIIAQMIMPAVEQIIADISPHAERREIEINEDGNEKAVLLLKVHAYTEAINMLDEIISNDDPDIADIENMAIALEVIGEYQDARDFWQQAIQLDESDKMAKAGIQRVEHIINAKKELHKQKLRKANSFKRKLYKDQ